MFIFLNLFFLFITAYHLLNTYILYGLLDGQFQSIFSVLKEIIWLIFFLFLIIKNWSEFKIHLQKFYKLYLIFLLLIIEAILVSYFNGKGLSDFIVGFKYNIYFLFIILSSIFIGGILYKKGFKIDVLMKKLFYLILGIILFSIVWQLAKFVLPDFFVMIGYGKIGDFVASQRPPIYYLTGHNGYPRLSGIFSGPNNYGYFLILFFSFFFYYLFNNGVFNIKNKIIKFLFSILYLVSAFFTLSRGVFVGIGAQLFLLFKKTKILSKKNFYYIVFIIFGLLIGFSILKGKSTFDHLLNSNNALMNFIAKPWGYGLGTSGPSVHYSNSILNIVPENIYLQIIIDMGIVGFIIRVWFFYELFSKIIFRLKNFENKDTIYLKMLLYGLIGLLFEGLFLHVFEDSMVNYLFLISFGFVLGYISYNKEE